MSKKFIVVLRRRGNEKPLHRGEATCFRSKQPVLPYLGPGIRTVPVFRSVAGGSSGQNPHRALDSYSVGVRLTLTQRRFKQYLSARERGV